MTNVPRQAIPFRTFVFASEKTLKGFARTGIRDQARGMNQSERESKTQDGELDGKEKSKISLPFALSLGN